MKNGESGELYTNGNLDKEVPLSPFTTTLVVDVSEGWDAQVLTIFTIINRRKEQMVISPDLTIIYQFRLIQHRY